MQFERRLDARLIFSIVAAGILSFTGVVIETAMNVTFPSLMKEFSISTSLVQWITTGYLLVLAVVIPTSGYLKERFPHEAAVSYGSRRIHCRYPFGGPGLRRSRYFSWGGCSKGREPVSHCR